MRRRVLSGVVGAILGTALCVPTVLMADKGDCPDVIEAADDLRELREELEVAEVDRRTRRRLERTASALEEMGALLASDEHSTPEDRVLAENLVAAAVSLERAATDADARQLHSVSGRALECADAVTRSCRLPE